MWASPHPREGPWALGLPGPLWGPSGGWAGPSPKPEAWRRAASSASLLRSVEGRGGRDAGGCPAAAGSRAAPAQGQGGLPEPMPGVGEAPQGGGQPEGDGQGQCGGVRPCSPPPGTPRGGGPVAEVDSHHGRLWISWLGWREGKEGRGLGGAQRPRPCPDYAPHVPPTKAELKSRKAVDALRRTVEKYNAARADFEQKMLDTAVVREGTGPGAAGCAQLGGIRTTSSPLLAEVVDRCHLRSGAAGRAGTYSPPPSLLLMLFRRGPGGVLGRERWGGWAHLAGARGRLQAQGRSPPRSLGLQLRPRAAQRRLGLEGARLAPSSWPELCPSTSRASLPPAGPTALLPPPAVPGGGGVSPAAHEGPGGLLRPLGGGHPRPDRAGEAQGPAGRLAGLRGACRAGRFWASLPGSADPHPAEPPPALPLFFLSHPPPKRWQEAGRGTPSSLGVFPERGNWGQLKVGWGGCCLLQGPPGAAEQGPDR